MNEPIVQVVKADPTPEELAALVTVIATRSAAAAPRQPQHAGDWATYWRNARAPFRPGPRRWRAGAHP